MKASSYIDMAVVEDRLLLHNLFNTALLAYDPQVAPLIRHLLDTPDAEPDHPVLAELRAQLIAEGFLIDDDSDELSALQARWDLSKSGQGEFGLQIGTTMQCNFRCPYCYEEHISQFLSDTHQRGLAAFVARNASNWRKLTVNWFGGEPLLRPGIIETLSEAFQQSCAAAGTEYDAAIITNGYLLTARNAAILAAGRVRELQITIDGDRARHDARRFLVNGRGTYDDIVRNIRDHHALFSKINLRINIAGHSVGDFEAILDDLAPARKTIVVGPMLTQTVDEADGRDQVSDAYLDSIDCIDRVSRIAQTRGFRVTGGLRAPGQIFCSAYNRNFFSVDAYGDVHKCVPMVGKRAHRIGTIAETGEMVWERPDGGHAWDFDPFADAECLACRFLPVCMGGCQNFPKSGKRWSGRCEVIHRRETDLRLMYRKRARDTSPATPEKTGVSSDG